MKTKRATTKPGWNISVEVRDTFTEFCKRKGTIAERDCEGALIIWQYLPSVLRDTAKAMASGEAQIETDFWKELEAGLQTALLKQLQIQQKQTAK